MGDVSLYNYIKVATIAKKMGETSWTQANPATVCYEYDTTYLGWYNSYGDGYVGQPVGIVIQKGNDAFNDYTVEINNWDYQ